MAARSYPSYRAPQADDTALISPAWETLGPLATANHAAVCSSEMQLAGHRLAALAATARERLVQAATAYTAQYCEVSACPPFNGATPLFLSGHQPELFHPGVWFKNFALARLSQQHNGVGIHLLVDSDLCRTPAVRAPTTTPPFSELLPYDSSAAPLPFEERQVLDRALFASFPQRLQERTRFLELEPLASELWPTAVREIARHGNLGRALSAARHTFERNLGGLTFELPFSMVAEFPEFHVLCSALLEDPARMRAAYNTALAEYRQAHRLRSAAQPLPDLAQVGEWIETPLWVWSDENPTRRPLFVKRQGANWRLTDLRGLDFDGSFFSHGEGAQALVPPGVKVRPRALLTTLACRLLLGDLFLHGIGGAKYDQVTDAFVENLWGVVLPPHVTLSATLRLPANREGATGVNSVIEATRQLRQLQFHPECFAPPNAASAEWIALKTRWISTAKTRENALERHRAIAVANESLSKLLTSEREVWDAKLSALKNSAAQNAVLASREFSLAIFPAQNLRRRMLDLLPNGAYR